MQAIGEYKEPVSIGPTGPTVATLVAPRVYRAKAKTFRISEYKEPRPRGRPRKDIDIRGEEDEEGKDENEIKPPIKTIDKNIRRMT